MEDLASMITQFLGSEEGMSQLRAVTEALGLDSSTAENGAAPNPAPTQGGDNKTPLPDLGGLLASLGGTKGGAAPDLGGLLSSLGGKGGAAPDLGGLLSSLGGAKGGTPDLGGLFSSLGGAKGGSGEESSGLDLNTMLLLGKAVSAFGQEDRNTELLRALKPHFSPERAKKVDDAIRILQLIRLLPLVKDLGILGGKGDDRR